MLREYNSIPCTVLACKIEKEGTVVKVSKEKGDEGTYEYTASGQGASRVRMEFKASTLPAVGDYIIQASDADVYHCSGGLFAKKYAVKGMYIL